MVLYYIFIVLFYPIFVIVVLYLCCYIVVVSIFVLSYCHIVVIVVVSSPPPVSELYVLLRVSPTIELLTSRRIGDPYGWDYRSCMDCSLLSPVPASPSCAEFL